MEYVCTIQQWWRSVFFLLDQSLVLGVQLESGLWIRMYIAFIPLKSIVIKTWDQMFHVHSGSSLLVQSFRSPIWELREGVRACSEFHSLIALWSGLIMRPSPKQAVARIPRDTSNPEEWDNDDDHHHHHHNQSCYHRQHENSFGNCHC